MVKSLAVTICSPPALAGAVKVAEKTPLASAVAVATSALSYLIVTVPVNPMPLTVISVPTLPVVWLRLALTETVKSTVAVLTPSLALTVLMPLAAEGTVNLLLKLPAASVVAVLT